MCFFLVSPSIVGMHPYASGGLILFEIGYFSSIAWYVHRDDGEYAAISVKWLQCNTCKIVYIFMVTHWRPFRMNLFQLRSASRCTHCCHTLLKNRICTSRASTAIYYCKSNCDGDQIQTQIEMSTQHKLRPMLALDTASRKTGKLNKIIKGTRNTCSKVEWRATSEIALKESQCRLSNCVSDVSTHIF